MIPANVREAMERMNGDDWTGNDAVVVAKFAVPVLERLEKSLAEAGDLRQKSLGDLDYDAATIYKVVVKHIASILEDAQDLRDSLAEKASGLKISQSQLMRELHTLNTIGQHAADVAKLIDAIRAIPPSPPKVREWVDRDGHRWRLIDGRLEVRSGATKHWIKSGLGSVEAMICRGRRYGIREITNTGGNQ